MTVAKSELLQPEVEPADQALERLVESNIYLFGHGVAEQEQVAKVMSDGLHMRRPDLFSTTVGLETLADDRQAFDHDRDMIKSWPHHDVKYVAVLGVERLEADAVPHRRYLSSIVQPREHKAEVDENFGSPYTVDRKFIAGYFDVKQDVFVGNPDFDPRYDAELLATTADEEIQRSRHQIDPRELLELMAGVGDRATKHEIVVPPSGQIDDKDSWVW